MVCYDVLLAAGSFIYDFQSLIAGSMAFGIAWYALRPVYKQLHLTQVQMAIATREVLIDRLEETERRSRGSTGELRTITDDFFAALYRFDPEGKPNIDANWAHDAEQTVSHVVENLKRQQMSKADSQIIDDKRAVVIGEAEALKDCLDDIHRPDSVNLDDPDYNFTPEKVSAEKALLDEACKVARGALISRIDKVRAAAKSLDEEFQAALAALRERIRQINDLVLKEGQARK